MRPLKTLSIHEILFLLAHRWLRRSRLATAGMILAVISLTIGQAESSAEVEYSPSQGRWAWTGAVTTDAAVIKGGGAVDASPDLLVSEDPDFENTLRVEATTSLDASRLGRAGAYRLEGLRPDTHYFYRWADLPEETKPFGRFRTMPRGEASFTFAFASCASTGSNSPVFDAIRQHQPLFFLHTGDLHYEDIAENRVERFYDAFARVLLASPRQNLFFRDLQVPYMWDDHDYGPNDSDIRAPGREAALESYRAVVPHYPFFHRDSDPLQPVGQAFSVGRVRFLIPDLRSRRTHNGLEDGPEKTMMGPEQLRWFLDELREAQGKYALTVFVSGVPWIDSSNRPDSWAEYAYERSRISNFMVEHGIDRVIMLAGDSHMVAGDDGSNNTFADDGIGPGFPVFHAAALHRRGSTKGGPYSHGTFPGSGRYGVVQVEDRGDSIRIIFEGRHFEEGVLLRMEHLFEVDPE